MREIKFRAKRKDDGKWICGDLINNFHTKRTYILTYTEVRKHKPNWCCGGKTPYNVVEHEVIPESVGQFTGLKDKNVKEIYDRDIVKFENANREVVWYNVHGGWYMRACGFTTELAMFQDHVEVIGNIYENPELLEKEVKRK